MTSNDIYSPYFYIIRHIATGKQYAGAKWGRKSYPSQFMTNGGYQTSSKLVKSIIQKEGLASFEIVELILETEIKIPFGWNSVFDYETWFLQSNNIAANPEWFNRYNNTLVNSKNGSMFSKTKEGRDIWSKARKLYLQNPDAMQTHKNNLRKLQQNQDIQRIKSIKMSGEKNPFFGKHHSEETLAKISTKLKGRTCWNSESIRVEKDGISSIFSSKNKVYKHLGISRKTFIDFIDTSIVIPADRIKLPSVVLIYSL